jgi:uncharacterized protein
MPSASDRFEDENCFIITNPGFGKFHLYGDDPDEIKIEVIANALSNQCRFTGHLIEGVWYSVGEHVCDVANIIRLMGGTVLEQFCGLMHDAPEFGLSDIAAPFKRELLAYYDKEALIWRRVAAKFGLPEKLPEIVKTADWRALFIEAHQFVVPGRVDILEGWVGADEHLKDALAMNYTMSGLPPGGAKPILLTKFKTLRAQLGLV